MDGSVCSARRVATICHPYHRAVLQLEASVFRLLGGRPRPRCHSDQVRGCFRPPIPYRPRRGTVVTSGASKSVPALQGLRLAETPSVLCMRAIRACTSITITNGGALWLPIFCEAVPLTWTACARTYGTCIAGRRSAELSSA